MDLTMDLNLKIGIIVSALIFIFPPLICFGMVSPMIIRLLSTKVNYAGKAAGTVYSVSTTGGIIATFFFGFYLIPEVGLTIGCVLVALAMGIFPLFYFLRNKTLPFVKVKPTKI
jgi:predicted membrane-bound spermidine synthase